jgi:hypothetical protein
MRLKLPSGASVLAVKNNVLCGWLLLSLPNAIPRSARITIGLASLSLSVPMNVLFAAEFTRTLLYDLDRGCTYRAVER